MTKDQMARRGPGAEGVAQSWRVVGLDTFAGEEYPVSRHATEEDAKEAARRFLRNIEQQQPSQSSGGQSGIQDHIYIVDPEGIRYRFE